MTGCNPNCHLKLLQNILQLINSKAINPLRLQTDIAPPSWDLIQTHIYFHLPGENH